MLRITSTDLAKLTGTAPPTARDPEPNALERAYGEHLDHLRHAGVIREIAFEAEKLRIGTDHTCTYTPDYRIVRADGVVEFHEVKGHWREDARVKIKTADAQHPYVFRAVCRRPKQERAEHGEWDVETITPKIPPWRQTVAALTAEP